MLTRNFGGILELKTNNIFSLLFQIWGLLINSFHIWIQAVEMVIRSVVVMFLSDVTFAVEQLRPMGKLLRITTFTDEVHIRLQFVNFLEWFIIIEATCILRFSDRWLGVLFVEEHLMLISRLKWTGTLCHICTRVLVILNRIILITPICKILIWFEVQIFHVFESFIWRDIEDGQMLCGEVNCRFASKDNWCSTAFQFSRRLIDHINLTIFGHRKLSTEFSLVVSQHNLLDRLSLVGNNVLAHLEIIGSTMFSFIEVHGILVEKRTTSLHASV